MAVRQNPLALRYGNLFQDPELCRLAGIQAEDKPREGRPRVTPVFKFGLHETGCPFSTVLIAKMRRHRIFALFDIWNCNAEKPHFCGRKDTRKGFEENNINWELATDPRYKCRGSKKTCDMWGKTDSLPCWRYHVRRHMEESHRTNGFVVFGEEWSGTGWGQSIDLEMASEVGVPVFTIQQRGKDEMPTDSQLDDLAGEVLRRFGTSLISKGSHAHHALASVWQNGSKLKDVEEKFKKDKTVVLAAVERHGMALEYASEELRKDIDVVLAAATADSGALMFAMKPLNQDSECLRAGDLHSDAPRVGEPYIVTSVRFSLDEMPDSEQVATLAKEIKAYIRKR